MPDEGGLLGRGLRGGGLWPWVVGVSRVDEGVSLEGKAGRAMGVVLCEDEVVGVVLCEGVAVGVVL